MLHTEVALLQVLPKPGDDPREDQVLRILLESGDVDHIHRAVLKAPEREVAGGAVIGDEPLAAERNVREPIADLPDGRDMVGPPALIVLLLQPAEHVAEPGIEVRERGYRVRPLEHRIGEPLVEYVLLDEIDQRIGLRVDVVLVQQHLRVLQHLAETPGEGGHVVEQCLVAAQRVERHTIRLVWREVLHVGERLGCHAAPLVEGAIGVADLARLIEEAEVRALHVEADRGDAALLRGKVREDGLQQPLDGARFRRETGDTGDVEVRSLRTDEKFGVEIDRRVGASGAIHPDRDAGARALCQIGVHPERGLDVRFVGEKDIAHRHRLQRFFRNVAEHRRRIQPDLRALGLLQ